MNKNIKHILNLICFLQILNISAKDKFDVANEHYNNGKFQDAISMYESILNSQKHSAELYFNLANAYYKTNKIAPAIYYYEKAKLLNPNDSDIIINLKYAQNRTIDQYEIVPKMGYGAIFHSLTSILHYNTWAKLSILFPFVFLAIFLLYYFNKNSILKRIFFVSLFVIFLGFIICLSSAFFEYNNYKNDQPAIVFAEKLEVKTEPKSNSTIAFTLYEGTKVMVVEQKENWRKVYIDNETLGWVKEETIQLIK
jgi:tetratricopeptide (TPR) repeat protein